MKSTCKVMIVAVACLLISSAAFAQWQTFTVDANATPGGLTYPTLTEAIATATAYPGGPHVIEIKAGTYYEYNDNTVYWTLDLMAQDSHQIIKEIKAIEDGVIFECPTGLNRTVDFLAMFRCGIATYGGTYVDINSDGDFPITIRGYDVGIYGGEPQNVTYANLVFEDCNIAIKMRETIHTDIYDVTIDDCDEGILIEDASGPSNDVTVGPNVVVTNITGAYGIYIHNSINSTVDGCTVNDVAGAGINVMTPNSPHWGTHNFGNTVSNNTVFNCGSNGITMTFQANGNIIGNTVHDCATDNTLAETFGGIALAGRGVITGNTCYNNGDGDDFDYGIAVDNLGNTFGGDINIGDNCLFGHAGVQGLDGIDLFGAGTSNNNWWHGNYYGDHDGSGSYVLATLGTDGSLPSTDWSPYPFDNSAVFAGGASSPIEIWDEVDIDVEWTIPGCSELDGATLGAYEFTLDYDETKFEFVSAEYNMLALTEEDAFFGQANEEEGALYTGIAVDEVAGTVTLAATNFSNPKAGDGVMASLTFQAIAVGAAADFTVGSTYLDGDANPVLVANTPLVAAVEDNTDPVIETLVVEDDVGDNTFGLNYDMAISGTVSDNYDLYHMWYAFDGGGWHAIGYVDGVADVYGDPTPFVVDLSLITGDGSHTLNLMVRDESANEGYFNHAFTLDNTGPTATDFTLTDPDGCADAGWTSSATVDISWTESETAVEWQLALPSLPEGWLLVAPTDYTFVGGDGPYTVHLQLKDAYGNIGPWTPGTAITLDQLAPAPSAAYTVPAGTTASPTFTGDCNLDGASGALYAKAVMGAVAPDCGDIVDLIADLGASPRFAFEIDTPDIDGDYDVTFASMDAAGNVGFVSTTIELDVTPPELLTFTMTDQEGQDCSEKQLIDWNITWSGDDAVTFRTTADLTAPITWFVHSGFVGTADPAEFTNANVVGSGEGTYLRYAQLVDDLDNESNVLDASIVIDWTAPAVGTVVAADKDGNGINANWSDDLEVDVTITGGTMDDYRLAETEIGLAAATYGAYADPTATTFTRADITTQGQAKRVYIEGQDCAENSETGSSNVVRFDLVAPVWNSIDINGVATVTNDINVTVNIDVTEPNRWKLWLSEDATFTVGVTEFLSPVAVGGFSFVLQTGDDDKTVYARMFDHAGNYADSFAEIELDGAPPVGSIGQIVSTNTLAADGYTSVREVTLEDITYSDDAEFMFIRNTQPGGSPQVDWIPVAPTHGTVTVPWQIASGWGTKEVEILFIDEASNFSVAWVGTEIEFSGAVPPAPSNATGVPGASVLLSWDAVPDAQLYHIRYNYGGEYPLYGSGTPPNPGTKLAGIFEAETTTNSYQFDGPQMDLYAFGIWTLSNHGVWSVDVTPNQEIVEHNYRLGDIMGQEEEPGADGCLSFDPEFVLLAVAFNTMFGDTYFNPEFDFSPIDSDPTGIATPDGDVDFDDLIIFALNYLWSRNEGNCEGLKSGGSAATSVIADVTVSAEVPAFARIGEEFSVPFSISEGGIAGYHLVFDYPDNVEVVSVNPGTAYENADKMFFYHDEDAASLDISSVVLSNGFEAGEIAVVTFRATATGMVNLEDKLLDVRDWNNETAEVEFSLVAKTGSLPTEYSLSQNYPNPFNPTTTIELAMPVAGQYKLTIYNIIGQVVASFEGHSDAGFVTFNWDASEQSSGVYLYRVEAGSFSDVRKMVLLK